MGCCTSDIYSTLKKEHGETFKKLIISSVSLTFLLSEVKMKLEELDTKIEQKRVKLQSKIQQREEMMMYYFNETKLNLDASIPSGIADYEQMRKVKINSILNLEEYKNYFSAINQQIDKEFQKRKQKLQEELQNSIHEAEQQQKINAYKIRNYHEMAEQKREEVRCKGMKEFEKEISLKIIAIKQKYANQLSIEAQIKQFDNIIFFERIDQLAKMAENKFKA